MKFYDLWCLFLISSFCPFLPPVSFEWFESHVYDHVRVALTCVFIKICAHSIKDFNFLSVVRFSRIPISSSSKFSWIWIVLFTIARFLNWDLWWLLEHCLYLFTLCGYSFLIHLFLSAAHNAEGHLMENSLMNLSQLIDFSYI